MFGCREQFFSGYCVSFFHELRLIIPQWIRYFLGKHLQAWVVYVKYIWQIILFKMYFYFKGALVAIHLSVTVINSESHFQWPIIFKDTEFLCTSTYSYLFFQRNWVNLQLWLQPFIRWMVLLIKEKLQPKYSFKFTVILQKRNFNKEISQILIIPPWFQGCIYRYIERSLL